MRSKLDRWPLLSFKEYENIINPKPTYQRKDVWKPEQRYMLIDSIIRGIDIPKIYLRELKNNEDYDFEIIDGRQRMTTLWDFLNNKLCFSESCKELYIKGLKYNIAEQYYSELDTKVKMERVHRYGLDVVIINDATEDEIADLFYRLNNGTPLSPAEVRNAMPGEMADIIRNLSKHTFFSKVSFNRGRYVYDQVVAQMMLLEIVEGIEDTRDRSLSKMYGDYIKSVPQNAIDNLLYILNILDKIFIEKSRFLNRASTINLYLLLSFLSKRTKLQSDFYKIFFEWYIRTEPLRLENNEYNGLFPLNWTPDS